MLDERKSSTISKITDTNGVASITGLTCGHHIEIMATHPKFYTSEKKMCFVAMGNKFEVKGRKWQPDPMACELRLRKILNPVKLVSYDFILQFPSTNGWYGVDLIRGDWVAPNGNGETSDVELYYSWEGESPKERIKDELVLRFPERPNGGTKMPVVKESLHSQAYSASTNLVCSESFSSTNTSHWNGHLTENDSDLTFRVRAVTNSTGEVVSCQYGRFRNVEYGIQRSRTAMVILQYDINPNSMDSNLE